jgi:hypothetical protein
VGGRGIGTNIYYLHNNAYRVNGLGSFVILQSSGMPHLDSKGDPVTLLVQVRSPLLRFCIVIWKNYICYLVPVNVLDFCVAELVIGYETLELGRLFI